MYALLEFNDLQISQRTEFSKIKNNKDINFEKVNIEKENITSFFNKDITEYLLFRSNLTKVIIPEGTKQISKGAFGMCMFLEHVILPNSIEYIDKHAFGSTGSLKTITWRGKTYYKYGKDKDDSFNTLFNDLKSLNITPEDISSREIFY